MPAWNSWKLRVHQVDRKIKILYFIQLPPPVHGVSSINKLVYESRVVNKHVDKDLLEIRFSDSIGGLRRFSLRKLGIFFILLFRLVAKMRRFRPDFVYFSLMAVGPAFFRDLCFVCIIKAFGVRPVYHLHNRGIRERSGSLLKRSLYRFVFKNSWIVHLSHGLLASEIEQLHPSRCITTVIPNGIPDAAPGDVYSKREKGKKINLLYVANMFPGKGYDDAILILHELEKRYKDVQLTMVGEFPDRVIKRDLYRMIDKLKIGDKVRFAGGLYGDDKSAAFRASDIFVFPSRFSQECFPLVLLEAMQFGLPVVAYSVGAIPEILKDGESGLLVPPGEIGAFTDALFRLIETPGQREKMGQLARKTYCENYSDAVMFNGLADLFEKRLTTVQ